MIKELTMEQEFKKEEYLDKWLTLLFNPDIDEAACTEGAKWLYKFSGLPEPDVIILDSPNAVIEKAKELRADSLQFSSYGNIHDYGWVAKYEFYHEVLGIEFKDNSFFHFRDFIASGIYDCIQLERACIVSRKPIKVHLDSQNRKHHPTESAIAFRDGFEGFFWKDMNVPKHWIVDQKSITKKEVKGIKNIELRRLLIDIIGFERWSSYFAINKDLLDEQTDHQGHPMRLWQFPFENRKVKILEVTDPTKFEKYYIWPEQSATNVWQAKGSTFGLSEQEIKAVIIES